MIKKMFLGLLLFLALAIALLLFIGGGPFATLWTSSAVVDGPRPGQIQNLRVTGQHKDFASLTANSNAGEILFGDFHTHTSFSLDAAIFGMPMALGSGVVMPSDACDFARYCSALDFWSINDHAEGMTPRSWEDSVNAIRACNAQAGDVKAPDMVSFVGWEWSQGGDNAETHYGHKNVVFREWEEGRVPTRPISSQKIYSILKAMPRPVRGLLALNNPFNEQQDFAAYFTESANVPVCDADTLTTELPTDCREVAATPDVLYRKLDEWGFDSVVIPHGLAWGRTNPRDADFAQQLPLHNPKYQTLIESFSGHGNSEVFADVARRVKNSDGSFSCPPASADFIPCCQRAGELIRQRCDEPDSSYCEQQVETAKRFAVAVVDDRSRGVVEDATNEDWGQCNQLLNSFLPAWNYIPRQSTQYNLALGDFSAPGKPKRARFGIMASSDGHKARPGAGYKQLDRTYMTDTKDVGKPGSGDAFAMFGNHNDDIATDNKRNPNPVNAAELSFFKGFQLPNRMGSFYYAGGLIAVHAPQRDRDGIWEGIDKKQVYGTTGERMLLWFDLLNAQSGTPAPMGSEVSLTENPRFRVRALGAFKQNPGCPDYSIQALGEERVADLCRGECYNPTNERKKITRIEVVRIRPQIHPDEAIAPLIDDVWKRFDCPADGNGCEVTFEDEDFHATERETLYYVRAIQEAQPTINGDNYRCESDAAGNCTSYNFCSGSDVGPDDDCLAPAEPRAWSSPIFIDFASK